MNTVFTLFLIIHITGGTLGLLTGTINLFRRKGDKVHKFTGNLFVAGMLSAGFSALVLSLIHLNYFLFVVGIFTCYMVGTAKRYVYLKLLEKGQKPLIIDWIISISMLLAGLLFVFWGVKQLLESQYFGIVLIVFGFISLNFVRMDINNYRGKIRFKNYWLLAHLQRMTGAYISAATAFLVVNLSYSPIPSFLVWLLPSIILTPLIFRWSRIYSAKV